MWEVARRQDLIRKGVAETEAGAFLVGCRVGGRDSVSDLCGGGSGQDGPVCSPHPYSLPVPDPWDTQCTIPLCEVPLASPPPS